MDDRGEKIVNLARAMLCSNYLEEPHPLKLRSYYSTSFRTICLTALISACAGGLLIGLFDEFYRPLNRYERIELEALADFAAKQKHQNKNAIINDMQNDLILPTLDAMTRRDYMRARNYLREQIK